MNPSWRPAPNPAPKGEVRIKWLPKACLYRCNGGSGGSKDSAVHDSSRHERERPGNQDSAYVDAEHCASVGANIVCPGAVERARHAEQGYRNEDVNRT